jgi:hypothetical protein
MCNICHKTVCCCEKRISVLGKKGDPGSIGPIGPTPVVAAKLNFYEEKISAVNVKDMASPNIYGFPTGYNTLTYTNTSGVSKDFIVHAAYDHKAEINSNNQKIENWVDGAIVKTVSAVDTVEYGNVDRIDVEASLFDGLLVGDAINIATPAPNNVTTAAPNPVEFRFITYEHAKNVAMFKKVTLLNGESVSLKFKTKDNTTPSQLLRAQIFVQEL